ncbi:MAG: large repetitive protein, partial [Acidobacteriaceae bacterium]|nr:large repetitive protein [Acidobacteriaceae bacterium]
MPLSSLRIGAALASFWICGSVHAIVLDWSAVTWTPGTLSNSYDVDAGIPGNDVTVTVSGNTAQLQPEIYSPNPQTPAITTNFQGGLPSPVSTLNLALDLTNQTQAVTITVGFSALYPQGVKNVSFQLFDIDFANASGSNYQDQIRSITALSIDGTTLIAPIITISPNNSLSGTGLNQVVNGTATTADLGAGSGGANVTIDFGSAWIKSFTFTYGSGSGTVADPTYEHIGIYNIDFSTVPEADTTWVTVLTCACAVGLASFQR